MQSIAKSYYQAGLHVIPIWKGKKNTTLKNWDKSTRVQESEIENLFQGNSIALVCGYVSGVEVIDVDNHFNDAETLLAEFGAIDGVSEILNFITIEKTPSGGYHLIYKCKKIGNNKKLASRKNQHGKKETLIETRGEGGYIVCYPSDGYELVQGSLTNIEEISLDERNILISAAQALNEWHIETQQAESNTVNYGNQRPGDVFNSSSEAPEIALRSLLNHGWKQARNHKHLVRPNKNIKDGISATFGHVAPGVLNVFSSNAYPFSEGGYTPYQIIALLEFNGDFSACSKALYEQGYKGKTLKKASQEKIEKELKKNLKKGRYLSPSQINDIAETLDEPVNLVNQHIEKIKAKNSELENYEDWPEVKKVEYFLHKKYQFRVDIIRRVAEMKTESSDWDTLNEHSVFRDMQTNEPDLKFNLDKLKSLLKSDFVERYNPFVDYFENLHQWNGQDHIKQLCTYFDVDNPDYFEIMMKKALIRNIKCALEPDYYNRIVVCFVSDKEEIGKSRFIMWLNPFGSLYYSDEILKDDKDSKLSLTETFIRNLEELDGLDKHGSAKLKATISKRGVTDRLPYAANKEYFPRCCTFWGSTNETEFLMNDKNTRWLPFYVRNIKWQEYIKEINVHDVWSQAWHAYCSGEDFELTEDEKSTRNQRNESYRIEDVEESILRQHFIPEDDAFMTNAEILSAIFEKSRGVRLSWTTVTLGKTLKRLGYEPSKQKNQRGWKIKYLNEF